MSVKSWRVDAVGLRRSAWATAAFAFALGVVAGAGPTSASSVGRHPGQAGESSVTVISYNVRGLLRAAEPKPHIDRDTVRFTEVVGEEIARRQADFVLLQEVCGSQAQRIADRSTQEGHQMFLRTVTDYPAQGAFRSEEAVEICGEVTSANKVPYGKAILVADRSARLDDPPVEAPAQCIRAVSPQPVRVCNFHLQAGDTTLLPEVELWMQSEPLIIGGDFNTTPQQDPVPRLTELMHEADPSNGSTIESPLVDIDPSKIDYIFADNVHFTDQVDGEVLSMRCTVVQFCSDHRMVAARFTFSGASTPPPPSTEPAEPTADLYNRTYELDCRNDPPTSHTDDRRSAPSGPGPTQRYPLTDGQFAKPDEIHIDMVKIDLVDLDGDGQNEATVLMECEGGLLGGGQGNDYLFAFKQTPQGWSQVGAPLTAWYIVYMDNGTYQSYDSCLLCGRPEYVEDPRLYKPTVWDVDPRNPPVFFAITHPPPVPLEQFAHDPDRWVGPCPCSPDTHPPDYDDDPTS